MTTPTINLTMPTLLRQSSASEQRECFCSDPVGMDISEDIRLACQCLVHRKCLITYLRVKMGDRVQIMSSMENARQRGIVCPYSGANTCNAVGAASFISLDDMTTLLSRTVVAEGSELPDDALAEFEVSRLRRWIEEENGTHSNSEKDVTREKETSSTLKKELSVQQEAETSDLYIISTTKSCPNCEFRVTHWHGHSCHHIQPGAGCPKCKVPFCYKCLSSGKTNSAERGAPNQCKCGGTPIVCYNLSEV